jgi:hypothetical protein
MDWPIPVHAPLMDADWYGRSVPDRVGQVAQWLGSACLAVGHSFGGWLLLCAAVDLFRSAEEVPPIVLLDSVLGVGSLGAGDATAVYSLPPRQASVHRALGLGAGSDPVFSPGDLEIVHAVDGDQCPVAMARRLAARYETTLVPGGHRLQSEQAREALSRVLDRHRRGLTSIGSSLHSSDHQAR